jgi:hypothetical protein
VNILSEPERKTILDTLFMRQYRKDKNDDMKFLAIVAGVIVLVVTIFVVWLVTRLDMPEPAGPAQEQTSAPSPAESTSGSGEAPAEEKPADIPLP